MSAAPAAADTHCPYCALQCAMSLTVSPSGPTPVTVAGRAFPTNRGGLCKKGWTSAELLGSAGRVLQPLVRRPDGGFDEASWDAALDLIADRLRDSRARFGADSVGVFGGGGLTNEKAYQLGKFARLALGTSRIDYNGRFCMSSAAAAGNRAFGADRGLPFPVEDLDAATTILLLGSNVAATMPPFIAHLAGARAAGGLIVCDPRRSSTARLTEDGAGIHLQPAPGTDLILLLGLTHIVITEGLADIGYLESRTTGFDAVRRSANVWWPERVQAATGVPVAQLRAVARRLADGRGSYILTGRGVEQHVDGTDTATAAINLALVLGLVGTGRSGYGTLTGQGNGQGGREHGQKCDQLPGYRKITDPSARAHVAGVWGVDAAVIPGPGVPAVELLAELGRAGGVRCLLVHGSNVVVSAPDVSAVRAGLEALDLLVVCDFFLSETALLADVVLPVTQWAEEEGTMTSLEGRVLRRQRALDAPAGVRSELWIMAELARRLDAPSTYSTVPSEVFDELARASAGGIADYSGLSHALLDTGAAAYWPFAAGTRGTPRLFLDGFAFPDRRARLIAVYPRINADAPAQVGGVLTLITGRLLEHYQSGAQTRRVPELINARPEATVQIHPATAARLGIVDGDIASISNARGTVEAMAEVTINIRHDTVFLPFHYAGSQCANLLTEAAVDPVSAMPEFKRTVVTVAALRAVPAVVAGAAAAAAGTGAVIEESEYV
ncbi:assimilatory nitrate reductase (NADH) alpha subunit apoprotein [Glaciihabitans tibetensis]|uniref:Assimilatory nitrate reductase (NADH) alpha subunit apoprotein n=1 Tax=Glaciihabitans tibetensis TaxID=1266600 RepID=A0A2T0V4B9_9MICO|nr:molybdopterin oxidoreductase family protein [Glaciihabitans tibetensis]PRY65010.1 assimilatory nitrate reductase (NADH) alpha subunit apoprotein [Glaciihabitans tibetensis]